ncbi:MAG TPA: LysM peptidoglycan-binding domain-containing protein [Chloroflexota bacterium]|nr:LysM peptidoglycan-binding domain-containing protein [Chloroflexota bacterium]
MQRFPRPARRLVIAGALSTALLGGGFAQQARAAGRAYTGLPSRSLSPSADPTSYTVQSGDTLSGIAGTYGTTVDALVAANHLSNGDVIVPGQILIIAGPGAAATSTTTSVSSSASAYTVQPGDTLSAIAAQVGVSLDALAAANSLAAPYLITAGESLTIPTASSAAGAPAGTVYSVQAGDTLSMIAGNYGVSVDALAVANNLSAPFLLTVGQQLVIPAATGTAAASAPTTSTVSGTVAATYVVQPGDTLAGIAGRLGFSLDSLVSANHLIDPSALQAGQSLALPTGSVTVDQATVGSILTTEAQAEGLDVGLLKAIAWQESGWRMVTAADGGIGIMQLMPDSVDWVSNTLLGSPINPYNPTDNIKAGAIMLRYYLSIYSDAAHAIAAYHQGMASVNAEGITPEGQQYVDNVLALQSQFGG